MRVAAVHADDVDIPRTPAELRFESTRQHVQRLEPDIARHRVACARSGMRHGLAVEKARARVDFEDRVAGSKRCAHQLLLQLVAAVAKVAALRADESRFGERPAQKRDLVHRRYDRRFVAAVWGQRACRGRCISAEPVDECGRRDVDVVRPAGMAKRPDDLRACVTRAFCPHRHCFEIEAAGTRGLAPADALAHAGDTGIARRPVIRFDALPVVARDVDTGARLRQAAEVIDAVEARHPEGAEHRRIGTSDRRMATPVQRRAPGSCRHERDG